MASSETDAGSGPKFVFGLVLVIVGAALLLERAAILTDFQLAQFWPLGIIAIGVAKLASRGEARRGAWFFIGLGTWFLVITLTPLQFDDTWPILLILWGVSMVWRALTCKGKSDPPPDLKVGPTMDLPTMDLRMLESPNGN